ncbi:MAG: efflux RND transporter periplasmic adaptor subunit [Pseudomonadales bacterium]|jgi:membrane fusion protein (multidrug efflux system)|nr:efflux RND transporter periplasmic adaptor subunit [Pseudomonadales bacterium]MDP6470245.1 efflux RND transporter periplasmic adaptor subunit [Pseudomonadales bacterium]MDP6827151.1 efflux RND transporter periplasmic adaptor subunit [Pseudomonadales bacterium]MDP6971757.1 efflux RND transporter periplasmic adaptor subunit [Pseudomonadales bacterium]
MYRGWIAVIVISAAVAGGLGYYKYQQIQAAIAMAAAFPEPIEAVEVFVSREELWQPVTSVTAEVVARRSVTLRNELAGTIEAVGFEPGDEVESGQLLLRLDTSEERANLAAAKAEAQVAKLDLARNQKLIASGAGTEEARDRARARFDAAMAVVRRLEAVIGKKTLRAPFAARAGLHELEAGQFLDKASTITRLMGLDEEIWVDFSLPQEQAALEISSSVMVTLGGPDGRSASARIIGRDAFVNERSRNVRFRALVTNDLLRAVPGSLASVEVPLGEARVAALVPVTSVRKDSFGAKVFVLQPAEEGARGDSRAESRSVTLGPQRGDLVIVVGVEVGERVAANGAFKLRHGVLVNGRTSEQTAAADAIFSEEGS